MKLNALRRQIRDNEHQDEHESVTQLLRSNPLSIGARERVLKASQQLVTVCRNKKISGGTLDAFLLEFGLANDEGVALMCLAEALLRVPDNLTADRLIAEKIQGGKWFNHLGQSESLFVNASTWGLMLTGHIVSLHSDITTETDTWLKRLTARMGEPVIRSAIMQAMRIMGEQYVLGRSIQEGIKKGIKRNGPKAKFSFDMLGEGARTEADAEAYFAAYSSAIDQIGISNTGSLDSVKDTDGISVKLSALHSRYYFAQYQRVMEELLSRIKALCLQAKKHNIGLSIDAEESYRLDISLSIFEALAYDTDLEGWQGLGFVLQAYQKRAPDIANWLVKLAQNTKRRLMVRLVKGAYWDAEIKHAQEFGLKSYPVFTRKSNTDLCYQYCAELLLAAPEAIFPQFATHNAYTTLIILELAGNKDFEFQRLHGMGDSLYRQLIKQYPDKTIPVRVYAPIGNHKDLLPYLVRRLLENGANSSFVNRFLDNKTPVEELLFDTRNAVMEAFPYEHKMIPVPEFLFENANEPRKNSRGIDLDSPLQTEELLTVVRKKSSERFIVHSLVNGISTGIALQDQFNPADNNHILGQYSMAEEEDILQAVEFAYSAQPKWDRLGHLNRADILDTVANYMEQETAEMIAIISSEGGRTLNDSLSEVREAIDFCRYYALQSRQISREKEANYTGRGVFLCISPWNFPLAIFTGQIAAALASGNSVIAKPAMQTPIIANYAVKLFHRAGVPSNVLQLLLGSGSKIGSILIEDTRISGIAFTGSTATALRINYQLAQRPGGPVPFIAETGGQNCMVVDSTALPEQVVDDVITSAFLSAGQRCSALRVLYIQDNIADKVLMMLKGAMESMHAGDPRLLSTDMGPVIDCGAASELHDHIERMIEEATLIAKIELGPNCKNGSFVAPHVFELQSINQLHDEVFGPILHVIRYSAQNLSAVINQINETGYGLTLGIHSRIEAFTETVFRNTIVGNTYINRNTVGAVVGVNPFGGRGLSGTGPKAGGPNYLYQFSNARTIGDQSSKNFDFNYNTKPLCSQLSDSVDRAKTAMVKWTSTSIQERVDMVLKVDEAIIETSLETLVKDKLSHPLHLPGPTGESNQLSLHGRGVMLLIIRDEDPRVAITLQIASALLCGCSLLICADESHDETIIDVLKRYEALGLPAGMLQTVALNIGASLIQHPDIAGVIANSFGANSSALRQEMAKRSGCIIPLIEWPKINADYNYRWLLGFLSERTRTENLVARGGNTQLYNLAN